MYTYDFQITKGMAVSEGDVTECSSTVICEQDGTDM